MAFGIWHLAFGIPLSVRKTGALRGNPSRNLVAFVKNLHKKKDFCAAARPQRVARGISADTEGPEPGRNLTFGFQPELWLQHVGGYPRFWFPMVSRFVWILVSPLHGIGHCQLYAC